MRVYVVSDPDSRPRYTFDVDAVCVASDASANDLEEAIREPVDACVVCCAISSDARRVLQAVAPQSRGCCVVLNCAYSNVFRLFDLRDVWAAWEHVVLVGESDDGGSTIPVYHMHSEVASESVVRAIAALFPRTRARECIDVFESHLFACGPSVAALLPPSGVSLALKEINDMRTIVRERATLCISGEPRRVESLGTWVYCRMLWRFRKVQQMSATDRSPILWDVLLFFYCVCRTFSLPCNQIGAHVHHGELKGLTSMMTDRKYIMRAEAVCACMHWLHGNRNTCVSCIMPMVCARTIDVRGHWFYALQPVIHPERVVASLIDARRAEWGDKPVPIRFLACDDLGDATIRMLFPSARSVMRVATVDMAIRTACKEKRSGLTVVSGTSVLADVVAVCYARVSDPKRRNVRYAPADGVFMRIDSI